MLPRIKVLGPFSRYVIWTQGCNRRCPGCMSPESRLWDGGAQYDVAEITKRILRYPETEGITISGGEPFLQAAALSNLIDSIRKERDFGVICYTGFTIEELSSDEAPPGSVGLLNRIDLLIDGPYVKELNDDGALRGSSNQRILPLTGRYRDYLSLYGAEGKRETEPKMIEDGFLVVGVPSKTTANLYHFGEE